MVSQPTPPPKLFHPATFFKVRSNFPSRFRFVLKHLHFRAYLPRFVVSMRNVWPSVGQNRRSFLQRCTLFGQIQGMVWVINKLQALPTPPYTPFSFKSLSAALGPEGEGGGFDSPSLPPLDSLPTLTTSPLALSRFLRRAAEGACKNRSAAPASARLFRPLDAPGQSCPGPR